MKKEIVIKENKKINELERQNKLLIAALMFYDAIFKFENVFNSDDKAGYDIKIDIHI